MRLFVLAIIFVTLLCNTVRSQSFSGGIKAGISTTQIDGDGYAGFDKFSPSFGAFILYPISDKIYLQLELGYVQKGSRDKADPSKNKFSSYRIALDYIELPISVKYSKKRYVILGGLDVNSLVNSEVTNEIGIVDPSPFSFKRFEIAYHIGTDIKVTKHLSFDIRYTRSFLPIANEVRFNQSTLGLYGGSYNTMLSFSLFYKIL